MDFQTREAVLLAYASDGGPEQWQLSPHATGRSTLRSTSPAGSGDFGCTARRQPESSGGR
ncbi:hypothetical protein [Enhygromyxa salina]|uniref:hypothetical protein n=1 Tax=Enhygromyxa salina TaxID=215803 RepID=UPI0011BAC0B1|nr:hypothetical protein [Enhygromyxa salina]